MKTMETYFVSCKKNAGNKKSSVRKTKKIGYQIVLFVANFIENQEASRLELHLVVFNKCFASIKFEIVRAK